jgi:hypothetical protein
MVSVSQHSDCNNYRGMSLLPTVFKILSNDSSGGIATSLIDDQSSGVPFPAGAENFSLHQCPEWR